MLDLKPIEDRLAAATAWPWKVVKKSRKKPVYLAIVDDLLIAPPDDVTCEYPDSDAELIANAPQDLSDLMAEVERLRDSIARHKRRCVIDPQPWDRDLWAVLDA